MSTINIIAAIIEIVKTGQIQSVEDLVKLAKFASIKLGVSFEQGIALVNQIVEQELTA
jgi:hypothetical protein